ncbi:MAG TPA: metallophosphoesterase [Beijerinckiaceae bacterium]|nr:metallophosphoesterase [Beijerinckiaceae bacterium]
MLSRRSLLKMLTGALAGAFGFGGYAFGIEPAHRLTLARYRLRPDRFGGLKLRIACFSDLHASEPQMGEARITAMVDLLNSLGADVILALGDYGMGQTFYARPVPLTRVSGLLSRLRAPLGQYAVLGNHDYWGSSLKNWPYTRAKVNDTADGYRTMLREGGFTLLENDVVRLSAAGRPFWLVGTGSSIALPIRASHFESFADLDGQLAKLTDDAPAILMAHEPDLFVRVPGRIALTLSGHTHGGQVRLFGYSPHTPSNYGNRFAYGHIIEDDRHLIVSGGLGTSVLPVRFGVPPEVLLIEIG